MILTGVLLSLALAFDFSVPRTITLRGSHDLCLDAQLTCRIPPCDTRLFLWTCNGHASQNWLFDEGSDKIQWAQDPTKCVDGGSMVQGNETFLWECNGAKQQNFGYNSDTGEIYFGASTDTSKPLAPHYALCLDSFAPATIGNRVQVWPCNRAQQQLFDVLWGTTLRLIDHYQSCLALPSASPQPGTTVQVYPCDGLAYCQSLPRCHHQGRRQSTHCLGVQQA